MFVTWVTVNMIICFLFQLLPPSSSTQQMICIFDFSGNQLHNMVILITKLILKCYVGNSMVFLSDYLLITTISILLIAFI